jgi:hypothetical protein
MQQQQPPTLPSGSRGLFNYPNSFGEPNPQMLPSPGPSFSVPSSLAGPSNRPPIPTSYNPLSNSLPAPPSAATIENSFMATMTRPSVITSATPLKWPDMQHQPPLSANSSSRRSSYSYDNKGTTWDKNRDQDLEREQRDRDRDWNYNVGSSSGRGGGGRYHDEDERYGSHRGNRGNNQGYGRPIDDWRR